MARFRSVLLLMMLSVVAHAQNTDDLSIAIASNDTAKAQAALDAGVDVNANVGRGRTPLHVAVMMTKPDMVRFLLEHHADPNREADDGAIGNALSAVFFAIPGMALMKRADPAFIQEHRAPALECLRLIAAARPQFDILVARGGTRMSPLMIAAEAGLPDAVKILLDAGASPNFVNGGKYGALDYAVDRVPPYVQIPPADRAEVVRLLLAAGAKKDKKGADGLTPLDRARKAGSTWAVEALTR